MASRKGVVTLTAQRGLVTSEHPRGFFRNLLRLFGGLYLPEPLRGALLCLLRDVGVVDGGLEACCNAGWFFGVFCSPNLCQRTDTRMSSTHQTLWMMKENGRRDPLLYTPAWNRGVSPGVMTSMTSHSITCSRLK